MEKKERKGKSEKRRRRGCMGPGTQPQSDTELEGQREGAEETAQRLRAVTTLPGVLSSVPSSHMVAHNLL